MGSLRSLRQKDTQVKIKKQYPYKFVGPSYDPDLDIKEIANRIREELKAAYPKGKFSVRIKRGGRNLTVVVKRTDFQVVNPEWVIWRVNNPDAVRSHTVSHYTPEAKALLERVKEIVDAYNFDDSDINSDYFHVNFYKSVYFDDFPGGFIDQQDITTAERLGLPTDVFLAGIEERRSYII